MTASVLECLYKSFGWTLINSEYIHLSSFFLTRTPGYLRAVRHNGRPTNLPPLDASHLSVGMRVRLTPLAVAYYMEEDYKYDRDGSSLTPTVCGTVIHVNKRKSVQVVSDERGRQAAYYDADFVEPIYDQPAPESILNELTMPK